MGNSYSYYKLGEPYDSEFLEWKQAHCGDSGIQDFSSPMFCTENPATLSQWPEWQIRTIISMNALLRASYAATRENILDLCAPGVSDETEREHIFDTIWPAFHWWANSSYGQQRIEELLSSLDFALPSTAVSTLYLNYLPENQRKYCIMHGVRNCDSGNFTVGQNGLEIRWDRKFSPNPFFDRDPGQWKSNRHLLEKLTLEEENSLQNRYPSSASSVGAKYRTFFIGPGIPGVKPQHLIDPGGIGNPLWTNDERKAAMDRILPEGFNDLWNEVYVTTGKIDEKCTYESCFEPSYEAGIQGNHYDNAIYGGMEPQLALTFHPYAIPGYDKSASGGAGSTWSNPCDQRGWLEAYLPYVAGVIGAALPLWFLPRSTGTYVMSVGVGGGLFFLSQDLYGLDAILQIGDTGDTDAAATFLTLGVGGGGTLFLLENGYVGQMSSVSSYGIAALAGAAAYTLTATEVALALKAGSGIGAILSAPVALLETAITFLVNGCASQWFHAPFACTCVEANRTGGKSHITEQWLTDIFGTTGQQYEMRKSCLQREMERGGWASTGDDSDVISQCVGVKMENPMACMTAQNWVSKEPFFPDEKRTNDQEKDMWNQVWHCLDRENPSFYPPQSESDRWCQQNHGEYFRAGPGNTCKDFTKPGPNNTDPIGLQDPGAFTQSNEGCVIL